MEFTFIITEWKRMCHTEGCAKCPVHPVWDRGDMPCPACFADAPKEVEEIIAKWSREHPRKTRADDFFEKHPKARKDCTGVPTVCCTDCGYCTESDCEALGEKDDPCMRCWNIPVENE